MPVVVVDGVKLPSKATVCVGYTTSSADLPKISLIDCLAADRHAAPDEVTTVTGCWSQATELGCCLRGLHYLVCRITEDLVDRLPGG